MTPDPAALEAAARALYEEALVPQGPWEEVSPLLREEVRRMTRTVVQAYLDALPKP